MEKVYIVTAICDYEYGCRENVGVFRSKEEAENFISEKGQDTVRFWNDVERDFFNIEEWEV